MTLVHFISVLAHSWFSVMPQPCSGDRNCCRCIIDVAML